MSGPFIKQLNCGFCNEEILEVRDQFNSLEKGISEEGNFRFCCKVLNKE